MIILLTSLLFLFQDTLWHSEKSPNGDILVVFVRNDSLEQHEVWLTEIKNPNNKFKLYTFNRHVTINFSADERWIVINNFIGSNISIIELFKRTEFLHYNNINANVDGKAWNLYSSITSSNDISTFIHRYSEFIKWRKNSTSFQLKIWAYDDSVHCVNDWFCNYDVNSLKAFK